MTNRVKLILGKGRRVITDTLMVVSDEVVAWTHVVIETRCSKGSETLVQELLLEANIRGFFHESWLDGIINAGSCWNLLSAYSCRMPRLVNHVYLAITLRLRHTARLDDVHLLTLFVYESALAWDDCLRFDHFIRLFDFKIGRGGASCEYVKRCMTFTQLHIDMIIKWWSQRFTRMVRDLYLFLSMFTFSNFICCIFASIVIGFLSLLALQLTLIVCILRCLLGHSARRFCSSLQRWLFLANDCATKRV